MPEDQVSLHVEDVGDEGGIIVEELAESIDQVRQPGRRDVDTGREGAGVGVHEVAQIEGREEKRDEPQPGRPHHRLAAVAERLPAPVREDLTEQLGPIFLRGVQRRVGPPGKGIEVHGEDGPDVAALDGDHGAHEPARAVPGDELLGEYRDRHLSEGAAERLGGPKRRVLPLGLAKRPRVRARPLDAELARRREHHLLITFVSCVYRHAS